jgi:phenylacetate-CoA ligase
MPTRATRHTGQKTFDACSSGSTGAPMCLKEDAETAGWYRASFMLGLEWAGWHLGQPHMQTGMHLHRDQGRALKDLLLRCHYVSAYDLSDDKLDANLAAIEKHELRFIMGYPSSLYYLAKRAGERGWNVALQAATTWGDMLYPHYRETIERVFKTQVYDQYGCAEGIQVSAQCGHGGYHINTLDVIVEFIDDAGQPVSAGTPGNMVLTRLHPGPTPLIRYAVGDVGVSGGVRICPCGRGYEMMESIQGRDTDVVITPSGNRLIVHFFTGVIEYYGEIDSFQVEQITPSSIVLRIVPANGYSPEIEARMLAELQANGAQDLNIHVEIVNEIPLTSGGKRRFVINRVGQS